MGCSSRSGPHLHVEVLGFHIDTIREVDEFDEGDSITPVIGRHEGVSRAGLRMVLERKDSHCSTAGSNHQLGTIWQRDVPEAFWRFLCGNRAAGAACYVCHHVCHHVTDMPVGWISVVQEVYTSIIATVFMACTRFGSGIDILSEADAGNIQNHIERFLGAYAKANKIEAWAHFQGTMKHVLRHRRFALTETSMDFIPS